VHSQQVSAQMISPQELLPALLTLVGPDTAMRQLVKQITSINCQYRWVETVIYSTSDELNRLVAVSKKSCSQLMHAYATTIPRVV